ncbi:peptide chain release factor N(5)-glutamine methyltransferase [Dokdonella sp.]|uniref:peptide chain release factor N(5)-glutamine methyltransferase n=1 Tax=Dokdonella sp. TaxID=2291710 RepID=UPI001B27821B|nr:peptide chain release factor N(5)-glutamine methyltransferase [Dokdonella sp.]MBO9663162.1 peptide chain release factor N(5)-glutamine methyltransferase [Dokdonella sp.]
MSAVRQLLAAGAARLGGEDARFEAELLLAHALGRTRAWLFAWPEFEPDAEQRAGYQRLLDARVRGEPIAYLTGRREFWSLDLAVTPAVLIPRAETELLVELALARIPNQREVAVADLGTGSGSIALALASERPLARVLATDASAEALAVARDNARRLGIANVVFAQGDWCAALGEARFDLIVSNPPYIEVGDAHLAQGDLRFEPPAALASGADGLDAIRRIAAEARAHLQGDGWLLFEHGHTQGEAVRGVLLANGYGRVSTERDVEGRERVSVGRA